MIELKIIVQKCIELLQGIELNNSLIIENDIIKTYNDIIMEENPTDFELNNIRFKNLYECSLIERICSTYVINKLINSINDNIEEVELIRNDRFNTIKYKHYEWYKNYYNDIEYHKKILVMLKKVFTIEGSKKIKLYHDGLAYTFNIYDSINDWIKGTSMELFYNK